MNGLEHIPGVTNLQADALSRQFAPEAKPFLRDLLGVTRDEMSLDSTFWKV